MLYTKGNLMFVGNSLGNKVECVVAFTFGVFICVTIMSLIMIPIIMNFTVVPITTILPFLFPQPNHTQFNSQTNPLLLFN